MNETENQKKLKVLKNVTFDWVKSLDDVWQIPKWDLPDLHHKALSDFQVELKHLMDQKDYLSPPGLVISGPGGTGKTHLLSRFCRETIKSGGYFLISDMSAIRDSLETVLKGMVKSLITPLDYFRGKTQMNHLAECILGFVKFQVPRDFTLRYTRHNPARLHRDLDKLQLKLSETHPREAVEYLDLLRTILLLNSQDPFLRKIAFSYLKGLPASMEDAMATGYTVGRGEAEQAISGLSFFMALGQGFSVLALDQMDHIVSLFSLITHDGDKDLSPSASTARAIITNLSDGLGRLTALTFRTLTVLSCLPLTWDKLLSYSSANTSLQRYRRPPIYLSPLNSQESIESLVAARLREACEQSEWLPPYPTWPFRPRAFQNIEGINPRALMEKCHRIIREQLLREDISEVDQIIDTGEPWLLSPGEDAFESFERSAPEGLSSGGDDYGENVTKEEESQDTSSFEGFDHELEPLYKLFEEYVIEADPEETKYDSDSDQFWPDALYALLEAYLAAFKPSRKKTLSLTPPKNLPRGLIELVSKDKGATERRLLLRANLYQSPKTFQHRMESMLYQATRRRGALYRLVLLRFIPRPTGDKSNELIARFDAMGGLWKKPTDSDIKELSAYLRLKNEVPDDLFLKWSVNSKPWERLTFLRDDLAFLT